MNSCITLIPIRSLCRCFMELIMMFSGCKETSTFTLSIYLILQRWACPYWMPSSWTVHIRTFLTLLFLFCICWEEKRRGWGRCRVVGWWKQFWWIFIIMSSNCRPATLCQSHRDHWHTYLKLIAVLPPINCYRFALGSFLCMCYMYVFSFCSSHFALL